MQGEAEKPLKTYTMKEEDGRLLAMVEEEDDAAQEDAFLDLRGRDEQPPRQHVVCHDSIMANGADTVRRRREGLAVSNPRRRTPVPTP